DAFPACLSLFFSLVPRALPCSTLFPYTTLFRSRGRGHITFVVDQIVRAAAASGGSCEDGVEERDAGGRSRAVLDLEHHPRNFHRSEEHTSELQSRFDLVCRLLLEKKNKNSQKNI